MNHILKWYVIWCFAKIDLIYLVLFTKLYSDPYQNFLSFLQNINDTKVEKIKPRFLDFKQDLQFDKSDNIPIIYKRNEENDFFEFTKMILS